MKVLRDGKEVKNANVSYFAGGQPAHVEIDGVHYDAAAFTFEDAKSEKKTRTAPKAEAKNDSIMTTENTAPRKK